LSQAIDTYSRTHPCGVSLERGTTGVPEDGRWHVVRGGTIVSSYRTLTAAQAAYAREVSVSGWIPSKRSAHRVDVAALAADEALARAEEFWGAAHSFRRKGGKGR
jgi:hypothetical protein